jgi:uncharacterized protein YjiS (DUF1127 family)
MTTIVQQQANLQAPLGLSLSGISQFLKRRAERARLARQLKELQNFDRHMLQDIGLKGFEHATPEARICMLAEASGH